MKILQSALAAGILCAMLSPLAATGQEPIYYPAKNQSAQQLGRDKGECQTWAKQSTGIDPVVLAQNPPPKVEKAPAVGGGERLKGAAMGAAVGGIAGGHGGEGAAIGALAGGAKARRNAAAQQQAGQQQVDSAYASKMNTYTRAVSACMEGRGYTVK